MPCPSPLSREAPVASIKAYRRTGGAVVSVEREGRAPRRYRVSLRRYGALREWTLRRPMGASGSWLKSSMTANLWAAKEVTGKAAL